MKRLTQIALEEAHHSKHHYKHGAVIFRQGKVLSKGHNETKRGFSGYKGFWEGSLHAEIAALLHARCDVRGCDLLVTRKHKRDSRPCSACLAAIKEAGIKRLFYTQDGVLVKEKV